MRTAVGLLLIVLCFLGTIFFRSYHGTVIPYPPLWYTLFIVLGLFGMRHIISSFKKSKKVIEDAINIANERFKSNAEKIELNFDECEFKNGSYAHQVEDPNISSVKFFAPTSIASTDTMITETVIQSYLTYTQSINGEVCKFISHSFPFDQTTLKFYVLNDNISLYVDRFNREKYLFDLKR